MFSGFIPFGFKLTGGALRILSVSTPQRRETNYLSLSDAVNVLLIMRNCLEQFRIFGAKSSTGTQNYRRESVIRPTVKTANLDSTVSRNTHFFCPRTNNVVTNAIKKLSVYTRKPTHKRLEVIILPCYDNRTFRFLKLFKKNMKKKSWVQNKI